MNPIEEHINLYQHFAPNPTAFRESFEKAISYAKSSNKHLNMDLRDYFAAQAMQGIIQVVKGCELGRDGSTIMPDSIRLSNVAYGMADAMMKAREQ